MFEKMLLFCNDIFCHTNFLSSAMLIFIIILNSTLATYKKSHHRLFVAVCMCEFVYFCLMLRYYRLKGGNNSNVLIFSIHLSSHGGEVMVYFPVSVVRVGRNEGKQKSQKHKPF